MTAQKEIELPCEIPNVVQAGIHPLATERAVNMSSIPCDKNSANTQFCCLAMMDAKIAAPVQSVRLYSGWRPLGEYLLYQIERWSFSFRVLDCCHDAPAVGAHRKNC